MFHDVGYVRYVAEGGIDAMNKVFRHPSHVGQRSTVELADLFWGSHVVEMVAIAVGGDNCARARALSLILEYYEYAWRQKVPQHGPLSAAVLLECARALRVEGRRRSETEAVLQLAATAALMHELHPTGPQAKDDDIRYPVVRELRRLVRRCRLPLLFRLVDELQCWFRPVLVPDTTNGTRTLLEYGITGIDVAPGGPPFSLRFDPRPAQAPGGPDPPGGKERRKVRYMLEHSAWLRSRFRLRW